MSKNLNEHVSIDIMHILVHAIMINNKYNLASIHGKNRIPKN